ncbi:uncharacterized protein LOC123298103 [Chrysoperla carnea]|uniref:uncharacterized protein LOC123298103 n=1 Tax=Chrysoperla carnea TaxID=189513 RepID=UPI001D082F69|nr:uncharacterized protein LOC123298103 [Chrysoperla carnea]
MLGIKSEKLINEISPDVVKSIEGMDRYRYNSRLNLLLTCIDIDKQFQHSSLRNMKRFNKLPSKQNYRESICKMKTILTKIVPKELNLRIIINYQIPNINIDGITIYKDSTKLLEIETLDNVVCLQNTPHSAPNGIMKLKIDLLKQKECPVIMVDYTRSKTNYELEMDLQNKLKLYM